MTEVEAQILLGKVVDFQLRSFRVSTLSTLEEKAEEIRSICFTGGGTPTCNLIGHYDDLGGAILKLLKELMCCHVCYKYIPKEKDRIKCDIADDPVFCSKDCMTIFLRDQGWE